MSKLGSSKGMTTRNYNGLARELRSTRPQSPDEARVSGGSPFVSVRWNMWCDCVNHIADFCKRGNPHFDVEKFKQACHNK